MKRLLGGLIAALLAAGGTYAAVRARNPKPFAQPNAQASPAPRWTVEPLKLAQGGRALTWDAGRSVMWILTNANTGVSGGPGTLTSYDPKTGREASFPVGGSLNGIGGCGGGIRADSGGAIWIGVQHRLIRFDPASAKFTEWKIPAPTRRVNDPCLKGAVADIALDGRDRVLVTAQGYADLLRFNPTNARWERFNIDPIGPHSLPGNAHGMVVIDDDHVLLSGTKLVSSRSAKSRRYVGVLDLRTRKVRLFEPRGQIFARLHDGTLAYASFETTEIGTLDPATGRYRTLLRENIRPFDLSVDDKGRLWIWEGQQAPVIRVLDPGTGDSQTYAYPVVQFTPDPGSHASCSYRMFRGSATCDPNKAVTLGVNSQAFVGDGRSRGWLVSGGFQGGAASNSYPTLYRLTVQ